MKTMTDMQKQDTAKRYEDAIRILKESAESGTPIEEGVFKAVAGGLAGLTVGPQIMKGVCKVLGIDEKGPMGNLMTSRMVLAALAAYLGLKN